ncbi:heptaprenyl diphosphate synthase [Lachnospiraceae bacterium C10]|jgi:heptaprenyl diphosphate synthase|nr:heptaprenyl diphosphate synthase [Lachnospiraceae bacterium C10]SDW54119.1 heptaprenyl diphosphate synthase [Lachnospiraceae bacterium KHCPX20]
MKMKQNTSYHSQNPHVHLATLGVFLALALIFSYVESLVPFYFGVPGMKLGLTNVVVVILLYLYGPRDALLVSLLRILLAGFLFTNAFSILYSLAGGLLSFCVMFLLVKMNFFKMIAVSVAGGLTHNIGQLLVAAVLVKNYNILFYLPVLMVAGIITGFLIGVISSAVHARVSTFL